MEFPLIFHLFHSRQARKLIKIKLVLHNSIKIIYLKRLPTFFNENLRWKIAWRCFLGLLKMIETLMLRRKFLSCTHLIVTKAWNGGNLQTIQDAFTHPAQTFSPQNTQSTNGFDLLSDNLPHSDFKEMKAMFVFPTLNH